MVSKAALTLKEWRDDILKFVKDNFDAIPDKWQEEALKAFSTNKKEYYKISLQACSGPGKSAVLAWCAWWFISLHADKGEHPKGVCVSVTQDNLKDNLWSELAKWMHKSKFLSNQFTWTQTRIFNNDYPETWFISARSFPKGADLETIGKTLSGLHSKYLAYFIDESGAIPPEIGKAALQGQGETIARPGGFCKIIQAGNPISTSGLLYSSSKSEDWHVIRITADPDDPMRTPRVSKEWAKEQIDKYGRDDSWVASYILGRFPNSSINTLLTVDEVEDAMNRTLNEAYYIYSQKRLGIDVARFGSDATVIFPRQGLAAFNYVEMRGATGPEVSARVALAKQRWKGEVLTFVDTTGGYGASVEDSLNLAGEQITPVNFSSKADDPRYFNKRSEMWFRMAEWVKKGGCLPKCQKLKKELCEPVYIFRNGKFALEEKDQIKKRLGFSPDVADALCVTFFSVDQPAKAEKEYLENRNNVVVDYDPFN